MDKIRITSVDDKYFEDFCSIYSISFPIYEQRTERQHIYALSQSNYHVECYIDDGVLIGFIVYWELDESIYIEHLAIQPSQRGQSYGSLILKDFITGNEKIIILEIDPLIDEVAEKRYRFYEKLGFVKNDFNHTHPAYREGYSDHQLIVLSTKRNLTSEEYQQFYENLKIDVMEYTLGSE